MNFKSKATGLAVILTIAIGLSMIVAGATPIGDKGANIDEYWWQVIESPSAQLMALTTHTVDAGRVPDPDDIDDLKGADMTISSTVRLGYNMLFTNNIVYPCDNVAMRQAIIRLIDKAALDELSWPLQRHMEYWLPESHSYHIDPDAALPTYDPATANDILNNAGYVYSTVPTPAGWYDPEVPGSQPYYRINPWTGQRMADFEYVTRPMEESPLYYEQSVTINDKLHAMGIPSRLTPKSWEFIVPILTNADPFDYQLLSGIGIVWCQWAPDILYSFLESSQFPLWNVWNFANEDADYWAAQMKATFDPDEMMTAIYELQAVANEYIPYVPLMQYSEYTTHAGAWEDSPGCIRIVNMAGIGATGGPSDALAFGTLSITNEWGKEYGVSGRIVGGGHVYRDYLSSDIDNLNPLMCNTVSGWQPLDCIMGDFLRLDPYTYEYRFMAIEDWATMAEWTGPNGEVGMTLEYTLRQDLQWQDGTPVTAADCVFALNLMRFQENERYLYVWAPIYDVVQTGTYSFKIWYLQRYLFAHEYFGISLFCPSNIWEPWVDSPETGEPLVIVAGAGPMGGDVWTSVGRHHSEFKPWEVAHPTDPDLTCLIGTDNFLFGHWKEKVSASIVAWNDEDNYMLGTRTSTRDPGDFNHDGVVDMIDVWIVLNRQGDFRGMCYPVEIGGHPRWDLRADMDYPAQICSGEELWEVGANFGNHYW